MVQAAEEIEGAVGELAHEIAGAVQPGAGVSAERIRNEALGGQVRAAEIAAREAGAADLELSGNAQRGEIAGSRDNVDADVRQRPADARGRRAGRERNGRRGHRAFSRPIDVPETGRALPAPREGGVAEAGVDGFAAHLDERGCGAAFAQAGVEERPELRRRAVEHVELLPAHGVHQRRGVEPHVLRQDVKGVAPGELDELLDGGVEGERGVDADPQRPCLLTVHRRRATPARSSPSRRAGRRRPWAGRSSRRCR